MRNGILVLFLFSAFVFAEDVTITKKVFDPGTPELFYEDISLALNEASKQTIVTWERHPGNHPDHSTLLRKLSSRGAAKGSTKLLVDGSNTYDPSVVYNKHRNEFALVYADELRNNPHAVFIQALNSQGQKTGSPVQVSLDTGSGFANAFPKIAYDPVERVYVVAWTRSTTSPGNFFPDEGTYVCVLNENFERVFGPELIKPAGTDITQIRFPQIDDITIAPDGERIVVALTEFVSANPTRANYLIASISRDLNQVVISKVNTKSVKVIIPEIRFLSLPSAFLVYYVDTNNVRKRKLNAVGKPTGPPSAAFSAPLKKKKLLHPAVTDVPGAGLTIRGLLVASEDPGQLNGNGKLWGQPLDANGKPIGSPIELDSGFKSLHSPAVIALPSSTAARARFSLLYVDGGQSEEPGAVSKLINLKISLPQ